MRMGGCANAQVTNTRNDTLDDCDFLGTRASGSEHVCRRQRLHQCSDIDLCSTGTCAQLAGTWQGDADRLTTWYSGWYNGLAHKHFLDLRKGKEAEHEVIVYCKANPDQLIIEAIAVVFKDMRARLGIEMKP